MSTTLDLLKIQRENAVGAASEGVIEIELEGMGFSYTVEVITSAGNPVTAYTEFLIRNIPAELTGKTVLDFGTGSGVLAIVASLAGAKQTIAIDRGVTANPQVSTL